jgi:hypothetical protein
MINSKILWLKEQKICCESSWKTCIAISKPNAYVHIHNVIIFEVLTNSPIPSDLRCVCVCMCGCACTCVHVHVYMYMCYIWVYMCWACVHSVTFELTNW